MLSPVPQPFFLDKSGTPVYAIYFPPMNEKACRGAILHVPAFGEEMNRSRHMIAKQARAFASEGFGVLIIDYCGTGDSFGAFAEATLEKWLCNIRAGIDWLTNKTGAEVSLWGLRFGCLMAAVVAHSGQHRLDNLIFWNPVLNGKLLMAQFLRLRLAASLVGNSGKETVAQLQEQLATEGMLEVAGYELPKKLYNDICSLTLAELMAGSVKSIFWFELSNSERIIPLPAQRIIDDWSAAGKEVKVIRAEGAQFWSTQEISHADRLIQVTSDCFQIMD